jgi:hypothetical protein
VLLHFVGQRQHAAGRLAVAATDHPVAVELGRALADRPADDRVVKLLRAFRIRSHQLIPDEVSLRSGLVFVRARGRVPNIGHGSISLVLRLNRLVRR